ncbi:bactofilin family protein [Caproiciproducens faecalis]|uniref:Polymer-forming cytoskeletal protein n=1 Tax=Caproiciproducens faecalis TaxID=2820301 RepID=A0ABS7DL70_9FIRM|nr:polymer-forming cytoskeletal protein [Caproiciproducens faecalis]MBW7572025.1 polymer-forming cytoskeletal protein [Caproiciproducens faecalis]
MEAVRGNDNSRFVNILKRIWDGPDYDVAEEVPAIKFGESKMVEFAREENVAEFKLEVKDDEPEEPKFSAPKPIETGRPEFQPLKPDFQPQKPYELPVANDYNSSKQTTVISKGTVITGDIKSEGNLEVYGTVTGGITTSGNIKINGKQIGDIQGSSITLSACTVRGNITATEDMNIDSDSVVIGDVRTKNLTINGRLQGNIQAKNSIVCQSNAIVIGDLKAGTVTVNNGAKLQGKLEIFSGQLGDIRIQDEDRPVRPLPVE